MSCYNLLPVKNFIVEKSGFRGVLRVIDFYFFLHILITVKNKSLRIETGIDIFDMVKYN
jgi:hypothetical protein